MLELNMRRNGIRALIKNEHRIVRKALRQEHAREEERRAIGGDHRDRSCGPPAQPPVSSAAAAVRRGDPFATVWFKKMLYGPTGLNRQRVELLLTVLKRQRRCHAIQYWENRRSGNNQKLMEMHQMRQFLREPLQHGKAKTASDKSLSFKPSTHQHTSRRGDQGFDHMMNKRWPLLLLLTAAGALEALEDISTEAFNTESSQELQK